MKILNKFIFFIIIINSSFSQTIDNFCIYSTFNAGFFCEIRKIINVLVQSEKFDVCVNNFEVNWSNKLFPYKDDPYQNAFYLYFNKINLSDKNSYKHMYVELPFLHHCGDRWFKWKEFLPYRKFVHDIVKKHLVINPNILSRADEFYSRYMAGYLCIGVHVRFAAAHNCEVYGGVVKLNDYFNSIDKLLKQFKNKKDSVRIFVATDSQYVIRQFYNRYKNKCTVLHIQAKRSTFEEEPHIKFLTEESALNYFDEFNRTKLGYAGGEEALIDAILLSKCKFFLHTNSNLAEHVSFLNPYINSIFLPEGYKSYTCNCKYAKEIFTP